MIGVVRFVLFIGAIAALAFWLADRPGTAHIVWHDYIIETSAAFLALCLFAMAYALHLIWRLWDFLRHGPAIWRLHRTLDKTRRGQALLTRGYAAIAAGDFSQAGRMAIASRKYLGQSAMTQLLQARAAQIAGDDRAAQEIFRTLAANDDTAVLGYRGLIESAERAGRWDDVDQFLAEAQKIKTPAPWFCLMRMQSAARRKDWTRAEKALTEAVSAKFMDSASGRRTRAALKIAISRAEALAGNKSGAMQAAEHAVKQSPDWLPSVINLVETLAATGHKRAALRAIERAWKKSPHPHLAEIVLRIEETPLDGYRQTERLCRANETSLESRLALAHAALAADIWGSARHHLMACIDARMASQRVFKLLATLERNERRDEHAAMIWMTKAADAKADPAWLCQVCGEAHKKWHPVCVKCGAFNAMEWQSPGQSRLTDMPEQKA